MNILFSATNIGNAFSNLWDSTGFKSYLPEYYLMHGYSLGIWGMFIMIVIAAFLIWLAIAKKFEPMLLLSIAFGMLIINIPGVYSVLYGTGGYTFTDEVGKVIAQGTLEDLCNSFAQYGAVYNNASAETLNASLDSLKNALSTHWAELGAIGEYTETCCKYGIIADKGLIYYL